MSVWSDVSFDSGTADQYASALQELVVDVETLKQLVDEHARDACKDWTGDSRQSFSASSDTLWEALDDAARRIEDQATEVRDELRAAQAEQAARARERVRLRDRMER